MRRSGEFDADGYLLANIDVAAAGLHPLMHYLEHGREEGRAQESKALAKIHARKAAPPASRNRLAGDLLFAAGAVVAGKANGAASGSNGEQAPEHAEEAFEGLWEKRPKSVTRFWTKEDAYFVFTRAHQANAEVAADVGSNTGFLAALLCAALGQAAESGQAPPSFQVVTYASAAGANNGGSHMADEARRLLPPELAERIIAGGSPTAEAGRNGGLDLRFLLLDVDRRHPWPTLELLAFLDSLAPEAEVAIHGLGANGRRAKKPGTGAVKLYDGLQVAKLAAGGEAASAGSITLPHDKEELRAQLLNILYAHAWEAEVGSDVTTRVLQTRTNGSAHAKPTPDAEGPANAEAAH